MLLITLAIAVPIVYASRRLSTVERYLRIASGLLSLAFGLFLAYHICFVEASDAIGTLRSGTIQKIGTGADSLEPLGLAVDAEGYVWYTNAQARAISRVSPDGAIKSFPLSTSIARLGRLAIAPDGAVWMGRAACSMLVSGTPRFAVPVLTWLRM
jgi:hypothetical protein